MKRKLLFVLAPLFFVSALKAGQKYPNGNYQTTPVYIDSGNRIRPFQVAVGTSTPALVYYSTQTASPLIGNYDSVDRYIVIQNHTVFDAACSTTNNFKFSNGPRWFVYGNGLSAPGLTFRAAPPQIWCILDPAAGATLELDGYVEYDSRD